MAAADWRAAVSCLLVLVALLVGGTSGSEDIIWPSDLSNFELWQMLDALEPAITGNALRISDLGIRVVDMVDKQFANIDPYFNEKGYTACKCRLDCLASSRCLAFETKTGGRCKLFSSRGVSIVNNPPKFNMQFKMLDAGVGDACLIDLECSRQTTDATCELDVTAGDNITTCQCPGDFVPHNGACVDPMSLTTTLATTTVAPTTTTETTEAPETTTAAAITTTVSAAQDAVTEGSVTLDDMTQEVEWPCDEDNIDTYPDACKFMEDVLDGAPEMWKKTVEGECDLARSRCKFPAVLSTNEDSVDTGAHRIEAWRSVGQFQFHLPDFPTPPADITETYSPGPTQPNEPWKYDCTTTDGTNTLLTGFLGLARDDKYGKNIPSDMDLMLCTRFTEIFLQVDATVGEVLDINAIGEFKCSPDHVITGVWDSDKTFEQPKKAKCSKLVTGSVNVDDPACVQTPRHASSNEALYWNACSQDSGPFVLTGLQLKDSPAEATVKEWELRCCPVIGPPTSTNVA